MKFFAKKRAARKSRAKKSVVKKALAKSKRQSISNVVKKVLSQRTEIKCVTSLRNFTNVGAVVSASTSLAGNYLVMSPSNSAQGYSMNTGTGNAQRIGNRVKTNKFVVQYTIQPKPYDAVSNTVLYPFFIRFWLVKSKLNPTVDPTVSQIQTQFFENGSSMTGLTGDLLDLTRRVCPDTFTYLTHWDHKIGYQQNPQHGNNNFQYNANNDFKMCAVNSVDLTKHIPKTIVFDDNNLINTPYVFLIWNIYSTGPSAYPVTQFPCKIAINSQYWYTDA